MPRGQGMRTFDRGRRHGLARGARLRPLSEAGKTEGLGPPQGDQMTASSASTGDRPYSILGLSLLDVGVATAVLVFAMRFIEMLNAYKELVCVFAFLLMLVYRLLKSCNIYRIGCLLYVLCSMYVEAWKNPKVLQLPPGDDELSRPWKKPKDMEKVPRLSRLWNGLARLVDSFVESWHAVDQLWDAEHAVQIRCRREKQDENQDDKITTGNSVPTDDSLEDPGGGCLPARASPSPSDVSSKSEAKKRHCVRRYYQRLSLMSREVQPKRNITCRSSRNKMDANGRQTWEDLSTEVTQAAGLEDVLGSDAKRNVLKTAEIGASDQSQVSAGRKLDAGTEILDVAAKDGRIQRPKKETVYHEDSRESCAKTDGQDEVRDVVLHEGSRMSEAGVSQDEAELTEGVCQNGQGCSFFSESHEGEKGQSRMGNRQKGNGRRQNRSKKGQGQACSSRSNGDVTACGSSGGGDDDRGKKDDDRNKDTGLMDLRKKKKKKKRKQKTAVDTKETGGTHNVGSEPACEESEPTDNINPRSSRTATAPPDDQVCRDRTGDRADLPTTCSVSDQQPEDPGTLKTQMSVSLQSQDVDYASPSGESSEELKLPLQCREDVSRMQYQRCGWQPSSDHDERVTFDTTKGASGPHATSPPVDTSGANDVTQEEAELKLPQQCTEDLACNISKSSTAGADVGRRHNASDSRRAGHSPMNIRNSVVLVEKCQQDLGKIEFLQQENRFLRRRYLCHKCSTNDFTLILCPCGHLLCHPCGHKQILCPVCDVTVELENRASFFP